MLDAEIRLTPITDQRKSEIVTASLSETSGNGNNVSLSDVDVGAHATGAITEEANV